MAARSNESFDPGCCVAEHDLVQESQCAQRLLMGRRARLVRYEVVKELFDLSFAELARVSAVKSH